MNIFLTIFNFFYEIFFGCSHERLTRPFTLQEQTYKVCLDCGNQVYYSPITMRPLSAREVRRMKAVQASEVRVMAPVSSTPSMIQPNERKSNAA
ncbi:hypothetical protein HNQ77_000237 [Silvibacterium bohemicum]|uniref:Uncharacterized protein n=1 Tax=Silvibacterium bohemicum TaxID=1577686 RepID=A0A841JR98_9BACT|nr:hypothetical protein [Silvibacterium bohemicum]MBB6142299.1 hypothetical protein [Silvibacterium bohemicum]